MHAFPTPIDGHFSVLSAVALVGRTTTLTLVHVLEGTSMLPLRLLSLAARTEGTIATAPATQAPGGIQSVRECIAEAARMYPSAPLLPVLWCRSRVTISHYATLTLLPLLPVRLLGLVVCDELRRILRLWSKCLSGAITRWDQVKGDGIKRGVVDSSMSLASTEKSSPRTKRKGAVAVVAESLVRGCFAIVELSTVVVVEQALSSRMLLEHNETNCPKLKELLVALSRSLTGLRFTDGSLCCQQGLLLFLGSAITASILHSVLAPRLRLVAEQAFSNVVRIRSFAMVIAVTSSSKKRAHHNRHAQSETPQTPSRNVSRSSSPTPIPTGRTPRRQSVPELSPPRSPSQLPQPLASDSSHAAVVSLAAKVAMLPLHAVVDWFIQHAINGSSKVASPDDLCLVQSEFHNTLTYLRSVELQDVLAVATTLPLDRNAWCCHVLFVLSECFFNYLLL